MTGAELVSEAIQYYDNVPSADAQNANRRLRILHYAQLVLDEVWNWRDWTFKFNTGTVSLTSGVGDLPPDFGRFGTEGLVYDASPREQWTEGFLGDVKALQVKGNSLERLYVVGSGARSLTFSGTASVGVGTNYVVFDAAIPVDVQPGDILDFLADPETLTVVYRVDDLTVITLETASVDHISENYDLTLNSAGIKPQLLIPDLGSKTLSVFYEKIPPTVVDSGSQLPLPAAYHRTVLLAGTVVKTQISKNDSRIYWEKQYALGLARMAINEQALSTRVKQMPMSVGRNSW